MKRHRRCSLLRNYPRHYFYSEPFPRPSRKKRILANWIGKPRGQRNAGIGGRLRPVPTRAGTPIARSFKSHLGFRANARAASPVPRDRPALGLHLFPQPPRLGPSSTLNGNRTQIELHERVVRAVLQLAFQKNPIPNRSSSPSIVSYKSRFISKKLRQLGCVE